MNEREASRVPPDSIAPVLQRSDGLLVVDASWTLARAARYCRGQNWIFPLARPLPAMDLRQACRLCPIFADAFVAEISGEVMGQSLATPRAPRAAMGPDLVGGVMTAFPLIRARTFHIRVFDAARTRVRRERFGSADAASAQIVAEMQAGRAFAIDAFRDRDTVHVSVLEAASPGEFIDGQDAGFVSSSTIRARQGQSMLPSDTSSIASALDKQARIVAAPFMGRVGWLNAADFKNRVVIDEDLEVACANLAACLVHAPNLAEDGQ